MLDGWDAWNGSIMKTDDGGQTWQEKYSDEDVNYMNSIYFHDENTGWAITSQSFLKTIDSGENWEEIAVDTTDHLYAKSLFFVNENKGWILQGFGPYIFITTNGGTDWQKIEIPVNTDILPCEFSLNSIFFVNENTGWIVGSNGIILKSTDGGETWEEHKK